MDTFYINSAFYEYLPNLVKIVNHPYSLIRQIKVLSFYYILFYILFFHTQKKCLGKHFFCSYYLIERKSMKNFLRGKFYLQDTSCTRIVYKKYKLQICRKLVKLCDVKKMRTVLIISSLF